MPRLASQDLEDNTLSIFPIYHLDLKDIFISPFSIHLKFICKNQELNKLFSADLLIAKFSFPLFITLFSSDRSSRTANVS